MLSPGKRGIGQESPRPRVNHIRLDDEKQLEDIYEFGKKLGSGSFGTVHLATHKSTNGTWAIKSVEKEKVSHCYVSSYDYTMRFIGYDSIQTR